MSNQNLLYAGKAKSLYHTQDPNTLLCVFRDDTSAFNGVKLAKLANKGKINNQFNAFIMEYLQDRGIQTHFIALKDDTSSLVRVLEMLPIECVVRNRAAGSLCKRLGIEKGQAFHPPIFEFFLKDDGLGDPFINESHITAFGWATEAEIAEMKMISLQVNNILAKLFDEADLTLVDFKLEFGRAHGSLFLGDEITPDGCRIWDKLTHKIMDKDRFRQELGDVVETYIEVAQRLKIPL